MSRLMSRLFVFLLLISILNIFPITSLFCADESAFDSARAEQPLKQGPEFIEEAKQKINALGQMIQVSEEGSWMDRVIASLIVATVSVLLFFILMLVTQHLEKVITAKEAIRESETVLRIKTFTKLLRWLGLIVISGIAFYMILGNFGIDVTPLLAGAGIVGLAFGFGGQYLIRDIINGIFILLEGQYRVNDVVKIGEHGGLVENVTLRTTTLRDLEGRVIFIPNGEIKTVINFTKDYAQAVFDIGIAYKENVDKVMEVIKQLGKEMRKDPYFGRLILDDLEMFGVDNFADSQVTIKFRIKTVPIKQWEVAREFRRRIKNKFDELGIEIPFPHRTLYWGIGKDNDWMKAFTHGSSK